MECYRLSIETPADRSIARERLRTAYDWLETNLDQSLCVLKTSSR